MRMLLLSPIVLVLGACDRDQIEAVPAPKPVETVAPAEPAGREDLARDFDLEAEKTRLGRWLEEQTAELDAKIDELERRGDERAEELAAIYRARRDQVRGKLSELRTRTARNWTNFERDVETAWNRLERDVEESLR